MRLDPGESQESQSCALQETLSLRNTKRYRSITEADRMAEIKRGELFFVRILRTALLYTRFSEARL
jgi:hypothetical protein